MAAGSGGCLRLIGRRFCGREDVRVARMSMCEQNLDQQLDAQGDRVGVTGALISDIVPQLLSYVAQVERESIHRRQAEGIAAAWARCVRFGRPKKRMPGLYKTPGKATLRGISPGR